MDDEYRIELFVFPDGTSVEMLVFNGERARRRSGDRSPQPSAAPHARAETEPPVAPSCGLSHTPPPCADETETAACPVCGGRLVYPVDWLRSGDASWDITLRCPECETRRDVTLGRAAVERFNRDLYQGAQTLAREAERMARRNFENEVERIVGALERDLILPMDF